MQPAFEYMVEYDQKNFEKYQRRVQNGYLEIKNNQQLTNIQFLSNLGSISKLVVKNCTNLKPVLETQTIKEITIISCGIYNIDKLKLEKVEVLNLSGNSLRQIPNIQSFINLKDLDLSGNNLKEISYLHSLKLKAGKSRDQFSNWTSFPDLAPGKRRKRANIFHQTG
ncbi:Conserved_hypothetical protein [Hexamita inflata]|uniref:Leucine rich repeat protein n=1 Tax=Hexamita inflata TaxID=28002 RepID=A0AA86Q6J2_9EUKA|nr:Conserved hypothetical protein [Hexamita inflata]